MQARREAVEGDWQITRSVELPQVPAMSARTRICPDCMAMNQEKTKVCRSPDCGYVWPVRSRKAPLAERVARSIASRSSVVSIRDLPPGAHLLESDFQEPLKRALCAAGRQTRVMRQNVGSVVTRNRAGQSTGRFTAGAFEGAADLSGIASVTVCGVVLGIRLEVEVKVAAPQQDNQKAFQAMITRMGGVYALVRYQPTLSLRDNVAAGVAQVDAAVAELVSSLTSTATPSV